MLPRLLYRFSKGVPFAVSRRYVGATALSKSPLVRQFPSSAEIGIRHHSSNNQNKEATIKVDNPQLMIAFTCKACNTRSSHTFSKQAYNKGTVAIQCPGCKNRHLIADNLGIFRDKKYNLEDILKAKGESVATSTEDLVFEDIPKDLRDTIGHYAKDAPEEYKKRLSEDEIRSLQNPDNNNKK